MVPKHHILCYNAIKKLEWRFLIVLILLKIEIEHLQISVPKIDKPVLKAACINPWQLSIRAAAGDCSVDCYVLLCKLSSFNPIYEKLRD